MALRLWSRWKRFAHRAAEIQSLIVLSVLYWVVVVPIGLLRKTRRSPKAEARWINRDAHRTIGLDEARRQG